MVVSWTPTKGPARRTRYEPHDGLGGDWMRITELKIAGEWSRRDCEVVESLAVENPVEDQP